MLEAIKYSVPLPHNLSIPEAGQRVAFNLLGGETWQKSIYGGITCYYVNYIYVNKKNSR